MVIGEDQSIVFIGDSVTDCGRAHPVGEGNDGLGDGYVRNFHALIDARYPERHIRVMNTGCSGQTSRELVKRWQEDVLLLTQDWVSILIGINDIWRQFDNPLKKEQHVYVDEYCQNLEWMVNQTIGRVKGICLTAPCYMEQNRQDPMRKMVDTYRGKAEEIAGKYHLLFADPQKDMDEYFKHYPPISMSWDRVHPNHVGHMMIAKTILNTFGFTW